MSEDNCGNCKFYEGRFMRCRRYPPTTVTITMTAEQTKGDCTYPTTGHTDWCGEHQLAGEEYDRRRAEIAAKMED